MKSIKKYNVLELHACLTHAGGERNMVTFCKYLNKDLFNVYAGSYMEGGAQESRLEKLGIAFFVSKGDVGEVLNFVKDKKIDILHIHRSGHSVIIETEIIKGSKKINPNIIIVEKNVFGKFDSVCDSDIDCHLFQSMMHIHERYLPKARSNFDFNRMKVFYNMVDSEEFEKNRLSKEEVLNYKKELGISENDFVIGKIARPHIAKWSDLVLDMMPYLTKLIPDIKFIIIGVPNSRIKKIRKSKYRNNVIIVDEIKEELGVHKFYQTIDVLAHASKIGECNGNTINEAMYWKKPVVVNSTPRKDNGQLEQIIHMKNGIIANCPQTYARAVEYLYKNPTKKMGMGQYGYEQTGRVNNPNFMTKRLEKVFIKKLVENGFHFDSGTLDLYAKISYNPDEQKILDYKQEYQQRLKHEFAKLSLVEKTINFLYKPKKFYIKIRDFIEHRFNI